MIPWFGTTASRREVIVGAEGLASRLLAVVPVIGCHLMATARPISINCLSTVGRGRVGRLPFGGNGPSLRRSNRVLASFAGSMIPSFRTTASRWAVIMGTKGLASRLLVAIAVIGCHLMATIRPFGINYLATVGHGRGDRLPFGGNGPSLRRDPTKSCPFKRRSNLVVTSFAGSMIPWFGTTASRRAVIMDTKGLAS
ncbi:uncharacterized protein G2W53_039986 [Senna tora]|uniref:Uncharacterized protein n=1 Tax=Senna tora TaxID=362788 RepID=A0A834SRZ8_9FABA|nr:uncharacterized protein G2W53_039986 [Senna tora]